MFKKTSQKVKTSLFAALIVLVGTVGLAVPALAGSYFEASLKPFHGKTWCASGEKNRDAERYYVEVVAHSPNGGHFWVDDKNGRYIGNAMKVERGDHDWSAYRGGKYGGYVTLFARAIPNVDHHLEVKGWYNLNG